MDPNLFHLDWERASEALGTIVFLAFFLERALSIVFEHRWYVGHMKDKGWKEPIAFALALAVCVTWKFDALSMVVLTEKTSLFGEAVTAGIIAGGSKGAVKLFVDKWNIGSTASKEARNPAAPVPPGPTV